MTEKLFIEILVFGLGVCVGSFLNVCIVRLPKEESVVNPPSHCVVCKKPLAWFDNVPLLSYLILGGRCRNCKSPYSIRYFLVELITGLSFLGFVEYFGLTAVTAAYLVMLSCFIVATFVDFEHRIIPDEVSVGGMFMGLGLSLIIPQLHGITPIPMEWLPHVKSFGWSLVGLLVGGGSIFLMGLLGDVIFKKESMGGGDMSSSLCFPSVSVRLVLTVIALKYFLL